MAKEQQAVRLEDLGVDARVLAALVGRAARTIKGPRWPEESRLVEVGLYRVWLGVTPVQGFRRAVITHREVRDFAVTLIDANPEKVRDARSKVMVYLERRGARAVGQVRLVHGRPYLVWFEDRDAGKPGAEEQAGACAPAADSEVPF